MRLWTEQATFQLLKKARPAHRSSVSGLLFVDPHDMPRFVLLSRLAGNAALCNRGYPHRGRLKPKYALDVKLIVSSTFWSSCCPVI